jgi:hypothetical protein
VKHAKHGWRETRSGWPPRFYIASGKRAAREAEEKAERKALAVIERLGASFGRAEADAIVSVHGADVASLIKALYAAADAAHAEAAGIAQIEQAFRHTVWASTDALKDKHAERSRVYNALLKATAPDWQAATRARKLATARETELRRRAESASIAYRLGVPLSSVRVGTVGDGEAWAQYVVLPRAAFADMPADEIEETAARVVGFSSYYNGAGQTFARAPFVDIGRTRVLVRQSGGLDI